MCRSGVGADLALHSTSYLPVDWEPRGNLCGCVLRHVTQTKLPLLPVSRRRARSPTPPVAPHSLPLLALSTVRRLAVSFTFLLFILNLSLG